MTCRTWENRCKRSSAASPGKVRIEGGNEAKRSTVELRSLAVGFCGRIKGCPEFMRSKGRPSILRSINFNGCRFKAIAGIRVRYDAAELRSLDPSHARAFGVRPLGLHRVRLPGRRWRRRLRTIARRGERHCQIYR